MTTQALRALAYVRNTNGGATLTHFLEDHEPIGLQLWAELHFLQLAFEDSGGTLHLTKKGDAFLSHEAEYTPAPPAPPNLDGPFAAAYAEAVRESKRLLGIATETSQAATHAHIAYHLSQRRVEKCLADLNNVLNQEAE